MKLEKLNSSEKRFIWISLLVATLCILYIHANYNAAFPQASIDLKLSKEQITARAAEFLRSRDLDPAGFRNLTLFAPHREASIYLERELGLEEANRLMRSRLAVWRWRARWFRPPDKEERIVQLAPDGRLVGFTQLVREDASGARLSKEDAFAIAEVFLRSHTQAAHKLIEDRLVERPNRNDYTFTWEEEGFRAKDATYRRTVDVQGGTVGRYNEFLHVPEAWQRNFAALRSRNNLWANGASAIRMLLVIVALVVIFRALRLRQISWRTVLPASGMAGVLMILTQWNSLPLAIDRAPTSTPLPETTAMILVLGVVPGAVYFLYVALAAAAGESLYDRAFPQHLPLAVALSRRAIRTKEFFIATLAGYGFTAGSIAFLVAFYLIGSRFGVWCPQEIRYSNLLSTYAPWLFPLTISLVAATSEEFWFRLFAIPLLKTRLRFTWMAVVLPALVWGFLHANYPQQPPYIRGIEVGVIGIALGYLMIRFGILATLIWHYTVDAVLIGMFLFHAESWYYRTAGFIVAGAVVIPLAVSVSSYWRRGGFEAREARVPEPARAPEPAPVAVPAEPEQITAHAQPAWRLRWLYVAGAVGILVALFVQPRPFGDFVQVRLRKADAQAIADAEMKRRNIDPQEWKQVPEFMSNLNAAPFEYVRRLSGREAAERAVREHADGAVWRIRYFQPSQKEEWHVYVDQAGTVARLDHLMDEKAPGAQLPPERARGIAETWLRARGIAFERWRLVDSQARKRESRTDHTFVWEDPDFMAGEARARVAVQVIGDDAAFQQTFIKLPEQWAREFQRPRIQKFLIPIMIGMFLVLALILFIRSVSAGDSRYHKGTYASVTAFSVAVVTTGFANDWSAVYNFYNTAMPWNTYLASMFIGMGIVVLVLAVLALLQIMALDIFRQLVTGDRPLTPPSFVRAVLSAALLWGLIVIAGRLMELAPGPRYSLNLWNTPPLTGFFPALEVITTAAAMALFVLFLIGAAVLVGIRLLRPWKRWAVAAAMAAVYAFSDAATPGQWALRFAVALIALGVLTLIVKTCAVDLVTFWVALFWIMVAEGASILAVQPVPELRWNGLAAAALAACVGVGALWTARPRAEAARQRFATTAA